MRFCYFSNADIRVDYKFQIKRSLNKHVHGHLKEIGLSELCRKLVTKTRSVADQVMSHLFTLTISSGIALQFVL